ncbi:MAG: DUF4173 domain-containing protein [Chitinispirillia bacterium]|nr:DUF4173 domain-containing protein [Chitinispirillia bacterium]MCL2269126.1 DUF4173 domain-containing protein [Chitinispirillia bacterium]
MSIPDNKLEEGRVPEQNPAEKQTEAKFPGPNPFDFIEQAEKQAKEYALGTDEAEEPAPSSPAEKALLPIALLLAVLFDRLVAAQGDSEHLKIFYGAFGLCYLGAFYLFFWKRLNLKRNPVSWYLGIGAAALCVWNFVRYGIEGAVPPSHHDNAQYTFITALVIPGVLIIHALWSTRAYSFKNPEGMAIAWLDVFLRYPFLGLPAMKKAARSLFNKANLPIAKRVLAGVLIAGLLLLVIVPLLMGADSVFSYYLSKLAASLNFVSLFWHTILVMLFFVLLYSFLWNIGFAGHKSMRIPEAWSIDSLISAIVMGSIILVYALFCLVQFTYLFAGTGLPAGMTYSDYAREGFAQTVAVCSINLLIFGLFLRFVAPNAVRTALLSGLLALTAVMLVSGGVRLNLYIAAYGMTWLRLLSAWFIVYLGAVILLCGAQPLRKKKIPIAAICFLMLLAWYAALGYLNPDGFIAAYNNHFFPDGVPMSGRR